MMDWANNCSNGLPACLRAIDAQVGGWFSGMLLLLITFAVLLMTLRWGKSTAVLLSAVITFFMATFYFLADLLSVQAVVVAVSYLAAALLWEVMFNK